MRVKGKSLFGIMLTPDFTLQWQIFSIKQSALGVSCEASNNVAIIAQRVLAHTYPPLFTFIYTFVHLGEPDLQRMDKLAEDSTQQHITRTQIVVVDHPILASHIVFTHTGIMRTGQYTCKHDIFLVRELSYQNIYIELRKVEMECCTFDLLLNEANINYALFRKCICRVIAEEFRCHVSRVAILYSTVGNLEMSGRVRFFC